jgi:hypothetical protein
MPSTGSIYKDIWTKEHIKGFYRGLEPNMGRNVCVNVGEMAAYDQFKELFLKYTPIKEGNLMFFLCGFGAGFTGTIVSSPCDVVKTRMMADPTKYKNLLDCFRKLAVENGFFGFYKGFVPNFVRISIWSITLFMTMERIKALMLNRKIGD